MHLARAVVCVLVWAPEYTCVGVCMCKRGRVPVKAARECVSVKHTYRNVMCGDADVTYVMCGAVLSSY